jgi:lipopolysaccharide export system permease protein
VFKLLQRMIFFELFRVFFLCWIALTGMFLLGGVIAEATQQGLGPAQILQIIPYVIPSTMPYTLPTTTLFATCVVYGRLAHDNEVLAVKAAGINLFQIALPALLFGGAASAATMALYCDLIPSTHWELVGARTMIFDNAEEFLYTVLRKEGQISHPALDYQINVERVEGRDLIKAVFRRKAKTGGFDFIAHGPKADISIDNDKKLIKVRMWNGTIQKGGEVDMFNEGWYELPAIEMKGLKAPVKRPTDMTWLEMAEFRSKYEDDISERQDQIAKHEAIIQLGGAPENYPEHVRNLKNEIQFLQGPLADIAKEYQMRPALALGCVCFVLVGCPVGIWFSRSDYLSSFITCFLPIILMYYPLILCGINLAKSGKMPAAPAIWPANAVVGLAGTFLLRRLMRS